MSSPILAIKLHIPAPRTKVVLRPRLITRINAGLSGKLTLISAPAGYGKTTLVSAWVGTCDRPVAWLSLDEGDSDPVRFLTYLIMALRTLVPTIGEGVLAALQVPQAVPLESLLSLLLNDLAKLQERLILVFDDYHVVSNPAVDKALAFLLDHLPMFVHLVIASREDPDLHLAQLRVRGQLSELRAADLCFTPAEAAEFFTHVMSIDLSTEAVVSLQNRTEGWIAGLQLAALALERNSAPRVYDDLSAFLQTFTGSHRFVLDYLVAEMLQRQPEHIQRFLLYTAILDRLCDSLCDAVLGKSPHATQALLEHLEHMNLLIIPLDESRHWYRYHHLFAEALRSRLLKTQPELVPTLHQRASLWYEQNGLPLEAIHHALAAVNYDYAARLIERAWPPMRRSRQEATFLRWLRALPESLMRGRPVLNVIYAWVLLDASELDAAEDRLHLAEQWLELPPDGIIIADEQQFRSLPAAIANARAYRAQAMNDVPGTVAHAQHALSLLPEDDHYERGTTSALLGLAYWTAGSLDAAYQSFAEGLESLQKGGGIVVRVGGTQILYSIRMAQGRLRDANRVIEETLRFALSHESRPLRGTAELYLSLCDLCQVRGDLPAAKEYWRMAASLRDSASLPGNGVIWCVVEAKCEASEGNLTRAFELLKEAERLYYPSPIPNVRPIAAIQVRLSLAAGQIAAAWAWVRERGLSVDDDLSYIREYEYLTLTRVLIARYRDERADHHLHNALALLERLLADAITGDRTGSVLEISMLQALALYAQGKLPAALARLEHALRLAETAGYVQVFVDEGEPLRALLTQAATHHLVPTFTHSVLSAFGRNGVSSEPTIAASPQRLHALTDPLSERELDVLRLLKTELSGPEIAEELSVALSTVRTHTKSIYSKLNVSNRRAAINRAIDLKII